MSGKPESPKPPEAFGIADLITSHVVEHRPGHDQSPPPPAGAQKQAELPPHKPDAAPRTSLAERLRQGSTNEEESK